MHPYDEKQERSEAYRIIADLFIRPPDEDMLDAIRNDFQIEFSENADEIAEEFSDLLALPDGRLQPVESLYRQDGDTDAEDIMDAYLKAGLVLDETVDLPADHLYLELLFFSHLVGTDRIEQQKIFLDAHLMNWVPYYCGEIVRTARTAFYRGIAALVREFLQIEHELYEE